MIVLWLAATPAQAACPDLDATVAEARALFEDAELEAAKARVQDAMHGLDCQGEVVDNATLLDLYWLDALVSITRDDRKGSTYATIRAVAANEDAPPPEDYGPDLAELYRTWSERLGGNRITVRVDGGGTVWVDGRPADAHRPLQVVEGEHLVQVQADGPLRSEVVELSADHLVVTGAPFTGISAPESAPLPAPVTPAPAPEPLAERAGRRRPAWVWITGLAAGGLAGFALGSAWVSEAQFHDATYRAPAFFGCEAGQDCYAGARERAIRADARVIRLAYGAGYGLTAVSAAFLGVGAVGLPARTAGGSVSVRF